MITKNNTKNKWVIPLGLLLALTAASCGNGTEESLSSAEGTSEPDVSSPVSQAEPASEPESEPESVVYDVPAPDLPELDYGGKVFRFMSCEGLTSGFLYAEAMTGETVNDAIFRRNLMIGEKFHLVMDRDVYDYMEIAELAAKLAMTGDQTYQVVFGNSTELGDRIPLGNFYDFCEIPHIDFSAPYWYQLSVSAMSSYGRIFMISSDICPTPLQNAYVLYFNKRILSENDLKDPYRLVDENQWTVDQFLSMVSAVSSDLNGDGVWDESDQYGIGAHSGRRAGTFMSLAIGSNMHFSKLGEDGGRVVDIDGEKMQTLIDKVRLVFRDQTKVLDASLLEARLGSYPSMLEFFVNGKLLFVSDSVGALQNVMLREMQDDFGVLPYPKYDSEQESYYHRSLPWMFVIPKVGQDLEMVGAVMQYGTWLSSYTVLPAYYEITIKKKRVRDEDAERMLDIVHDTVYVDFSDLYDTHISDYVWNSYEAGSFARVFGTTLKKMTKTLNSIQTKLRNIE